MCSRWALVRPSQAGKIGAPSPSPSWGRRKLQAAICPDFHKASTPSETGFPACGGSSGSTWQEYPSLLGTPDALPHDREPSTAMAT